MQVSFLQLPACSHRTMISPLGEFSGRTEEDMEKSRLILHDPSNRVRPGTSGLWKVNDSPLPVRASMWLDAREALAYLSPLKKTATSVNCYSRFGVFPGVLVASEDKTPCRREYGEKEMIGLGWRDNVLAHDVQVTDWLGHVPGSDNATLAARLYLPAIVHGSRSLNVHQNNKTGSVSSMRTRQCDQRMTKKKPDKSNLQLWDAGPCVKVASVLRPAPPRN